MYYRRRDPRYCNCGQHTLSSMPTDHFCQHAAATSPSGLILVHEPANTVTAMSKELREWEEAVVRAQRRMASEHHEAWRDRRRRWREEAAQSFARGPHR